MVLLVGTTAFFMLINETTLGTQLQITAKNLKLIL